MLAALAAAAAALLTLGAALAALAAAAARGWQGRRQGRRVGRRHAGCMRQAQHHPSTPNALFAVLQHAGAEGLEAAPALVGPRLGAPAGRWGRAQVRACRRRGSVELQPPAATPAQRPRRGPADMQVPSVHTAPRWQRVKQAEQWRRLVSTSTQRPAQRSVSTGQPSSPPWHTPLKQRPEGHTLPQKPQFIGSSCREVQPRLGQGVRPSGHLRGRSRVQRGRGAWQPAARGRCTLPPARHSHAAAHAALLSRLALLAARAAVHRVLRAAEPAAAVVQGERQRHGAAPGWRVPPPPAEGAAPGPPPGLP